MIIPFIALLVVLIVIVAFISSNAKKKDKGNIPRTDE
jgi:hypothetical protein